jgi:hypothetical protein
MLWFKSDIIGIGLAKFLDLAGLATGPMAV